MKVLASEIIFLKVTKAWQSNRNAGLSGCCSRGVRSVGETFLLLQNPLASLRSLRQKKFSSSIYSHPDARRRQRKLVPCLEDYFSARWSFPHSSLWGCWLSAAGCLDYILVSWSVLSGQAAHTQVSFSSGCVHKRLSVHKHRPKLSPGGRSKATSHGAPMQF